MNMVSEKQIKLRFARNYMDAKTRFDTDKKENAHISAHYQLGRMDAIRQAYAEMYNISFDQATLELDNIAIRQAYAEMYNISFDQATLELDSVAFDV